MRRLAGNPEEAFGRLRFVEPVADVVQIGVAVDAADPADVAGRFEVRRDFKFAERRYDDVPFGIGSGWIDFGLQREFPWPHVVISERRDVRAVFVHPACVCYDIDFFGNVQARDDSGGIGLGPFVENVERENVFARFEEVGGNSMNVGGVEVISGTDVDAVELCRVDVVGGRDEVNVVKIRDVNGFGEFERFRKDAAFVCRHVVFRTSPNPFRVRKIRVPIDCRSGFLDGRRRVIARPNCLYRFAQSLVRVGIIDERRRAFRRGADHGYAGVGEFFELKRQLKRHFRRVWQYENRILNAVGKDDFAVLTARRIDENLRTARVETVFALIFKLAGQKRGIRGDKDLRRSLAVQIEDVAGRFAAL